MEITSLIEASEYCSIQDETYNNCFLLENPLLIGWIKIIMGVKYHMGKNYLDKRLLLNSERTI